MRNVYIPPPAPRHCGYSRHAINGLLLALCSLAGGFIMLGYFLG